MDLIKMIFHCCKRGTQLCNVTVLYLWAGLEDIVHLRLCNPAAASCSTAAMCRAWFSRLCEGAAASAFSARVFKVALSSMSPATASARASGSSAGTQWPAPSASMMLLASPSGAASRTGTPEAMAALLNAMLHDPKWGGDAEYVARRQEMALMPGAWECAAAARFKSPAAAAKSSGFGAADVTPYENIAFPTLIVAGAEDRLREKGYANGLAERIPDCELHVLEDCGHCPNIEKSKIFNDLVVGFLKRVHAGG